MSAIMEGTRFDPNRRFRGAIEELPVIYMYRNSDIPGVIKFYMNSAASTLTGDGFVKDVPITYENGSVKVSGVITSVTSTNNSINGKVANSVITISFNGPLPDSMYDGYIHVGSADPAQSSSKLNTELPAPDSLSTTPETVSDKVSAAVATATTAVKKYYLVGIIVIVVGGYFIYKKLKK